jgi:hypothetical protein
MNNSHIGAIAETAVELDLMKRGFNVGRTTAPARYDRMVDIGGGQFVRLQIKSGSYYGDTILVAYGESNSYTAEEVEIIAVYADGDVYYVPIADVAHCKKSFTLRIRPAKRPSDNTRYATNYVDFPYVPPQKPAKEIAN